MLLLDELAEKRILEAQQRGEFDDLPGAGRPLELDDDRDVPEVLRIAYRVLRNAGVVPPELAARREFASLSALLVAADEDAARGISRRLALLGARIGLRPDSPYYSRTLRRRGLDG